MSYSLPDSANLLQLKHQAKDLLKAHKRGDPACCEVLRQLPQFADLPDADILAAAVKLDDVQFALARHYGFDGWAAMKRHVEGLRWDATNINLESRADGKVIKGLEGIDLGGSFTWPLDSAGVAAAAIVRATGGVATYEDVMASNGFAFSGILDSYGPSPFQTLFGIDIHSGVGLKEYGFDVMNWYPDTPRPWMEPGEDQWPLRVMESVDAGVPVMFHYGPRPGRWGLVCGYSDGGHTWTVLPYPGGDHYEELVSVDKRSLDTMIYVFTKVSDAIPRRELKIESLRAAEWSSRPMVSDEGGGKRMWGRAAYGGWIEGLRRSDVDWTPELRTRNAAAYFNLRSLRGTAAVCLRQIADELPATAEHLYIAADSYQSIADRLETNRSVTTHPFDEAWTADHRARQADLLEQCLADENAGVAKIEQALAAIEE